MNWHAEFLHSINFVRKKRFFSSHNRLSWSDRKKSAWKMSEDYLAHELTRDEFAILKLSQICNPLLFLCCCYCCCWKVIVWIARKKFNNWDHMIKICFFLFNFKKEKQQRWKRADDSQKDTQKTLAWFALAVCGVSVVLFCKMHTKCHDWYIRIRTMQKRWINKSNGGFFEIERDLF